MDERFYLQKLKEDFSKRKRANAVYSLRAYGRDLGIHPSTLSQILSGKRPLPSKNINRVTDKLKLRADDRIRFLRSANKVETILDNIKLPKTDNRLVLDETYFQIIAEWEYYAALTLFDCDGFIPTIPNISVRLNISILRAEVVIENLLRYGLIKTDSENIYVKAQSSVKTTEDVSSAALRASHHDTLDLGHKKLDEIAIELRDFSSIMLAIDPRKIPEAKIVLREFRQKFSQLLKDGKQSEVYQLAIQFYPLTETKNLNATLTPLSRSKRLK